MISVIVPTYDCAEYLDSCLKSLFNQTYRDKEIIVVDDGSTDNTKEVLKQYNVKVLRHRKNRGSNPARNTGYKKAKGDFLIFCDADAEYDETFLERLYLALRSNNAAFAYCGYRLRGLVNGTLPSRPFSDRALIQNNYINSASLIRREWFPKGGWDANIKRLQDWDLFLTIVLNGGRGVFVDDVLFTLYVRPDGISARDRLNFDNAKIKIYDKHKIFYA